MKYEDVELRVDTVMRRMEMEVEGSVAFIEYRISGKLLFLIHTEVPPALSGKGAGSAIVEKALRYAKENGLKIIPICPFVRTFIGKHPEWKDMVSEEAGRFID